MKGIHNVSPNEPAIDSQDGGLSLAALTPLVSRFGRETSAKKNTGKKALSSAQRANNYIGFCVELGSEPTVDAVKPGGTTVTCQSDGRSETCTFTSKNTRCHANAVFPGNQPATSQPTPGDVPTVPLVPIEGNLNSTDGNSRNRRKR